MQIYFDELSGKHFFKMNLILKSHQKHMSMEELDERLLRELESLKLLAIDKLKYAVNWLVLVLRLIRNILTRYKIYL